MRDDLLRRLDSVLTLMEQSANGDARDIAELVRASDDWIDMMDDERLAALVTEYENAFQKEAK